jgi:glutamate-1-semialdehyde 2,1-aminomutase
VIAESTGIPPGNADLVTVLPFNDVETLEITLRSKGDQLGALIMEPINYDSCGIRPDPEFLRTLRHLTRELGIVLIFDEVLSGFRTGPGSAVADTGVIPDMTVLGKAVGGGMPLSVFMGTREVMEFCTPTGPAVHSGTYNAHLALVAAARAFLQEVSQIGFYDRLNALGQRLYSGMREIFRRRGVKAWVQGVGCRFGLLFGLDLEPRNYRDTLKQDVDMMGVFNLECLKRGLYLLHWSPHHGYSSAHTMADIEEALDVIDQVAKEIV